MTSEFTASTAVSSCFLTFSTSLNLTSAFCPRRGPPPGHRRLGGPRFRPALSPRGATRRVPGQRAASRAPPHGPCRPASATELLHPAHCPPPPPPARLGSGPLTWGPAQQGTDQSGPQRAGQPPHRAGIPHTRAGLDGPLIPFRTAESGMGGLRKPRTAPGGTMKRYGHEKRLKTCS